MAKTPSSEIRSPETSSAGDRPVPTDHWLSQIGTLLHELQSDAQPEAAPPTVIDEATDNQLVQVRLGTASSLFVALQCKHAATASHTLRVALSCSAWALRMELDAGRRDVIEIAALLHDVGVIGTPDKILYKPGVLDADETALVTQSRRMSLEILRQSCASQEILEIVKHVGTWYDGTREGFQLRGEEIPLGSRMVTIVEAFDAMVTDHVYRPAMSQELAMTELFDCAGKQFDPALVQQFAELHSCNQTELRREVAGRWLKSLDPKGANSYWQLNRAPSSQGPPNVDLLFQTKLLENMYDAVVFIDTGGQVVLWNRGAERLTGIAGSSVRQRQWQSDLLSICDERGEAIAEADCPVNCAIQSGVQSLRRLKIWGRAGRPVAVDTHAIPVIADNGTTMGAILLFHDASSETSLEKRCQSLHEKATKDPMTQVANRAEFDRVHEMFVTAHEQQQIPCSLLICDLDKFKQVNDTYGHQAGDDAIISLARLLKAYCHPGDLVARYGGEEFVVLCADCDNAAAARRAELVRKTLAQMAQPKLDGRCVTVSFGVTEIQPGDTPETMLRRADRALLMAKSKGRNNVVQLGIGSGGEELGKTRRFWRRKQTLPKEVIKRVLATPVPVKMAIEKLRGFVTDHQAKIIKIDGNHIELEIVNHSGVRLRRSADRPVVFTVDLQFGEQRTCREDGKLPADAPVRTQIGLTISPKKDRDRRRNGISDQAQDVLVSFKSYLMAIEEGDEATPPDGGVLTRARQILAPWMIKK